jgi:hypothetical protein
MEIETIWIIMGCCFAVAFCGVGYVTYRTLKNPPVLIITDKNGDKTTITTRF